MTIESRTYNLELGSQYIVAPELANVIIMEVRREGLQYESSGTAAPGNREYAYTASVGVIEFETAGSIGYTVNGAGEIYGAEKVNIVFKY